MSGQVGIFSLITGQDDAKAIELITNIVEKTKGGKINWRRDASSLIASLPGIQIVFLRSSNVLNSLLGRLTGSGGGWDMLSVRKNDGSEILKVEQPSGPIVPTVPIVRSKLVQAVDQLFLLADAKGQDEIDKAIDVVKNL